MTLGKDINWICYDLTLKVQQYNLLFDRGNFSLQLFN
jgi:hypothetical protein